MFAETTLLFKTMVILSGQIGIVFGMAYFIIQKAKVAYENKQNYLDILLEQQ